ncbi:MAG: T9SS type A sorting domain-containing protein [Bacteroidales bacterium]|nr:T9SS type A sorting domain-containing protein [Bacteroidales bacterium]
MDNLTPDGFLLGQNYPNPFNGVTWVPFTLALPGRVKIDVLNFLGQSVRTILNDYYTSGSHLVRVDLNDVSNGLYWCRLETGGRAQTIRLVLSK